MILIQITRTILIQMIIRIMQKIKIRIRVKAVLKIKQMLLYHLLELSRHVLIVQKILIKNFVTILRLHKVYGLELVVIQMISQQNALILTRIIVQVNFQIHLFNITRNVLKLKIQILAQKRIHQFLYQKNLLKLHHSIIYQSVLLNNQILVLFQQLVCIKQA